MSAARSRRLAIGGPLQGVPLHAQRDWIVALADLGYTDFWTNEAYNVDGFTPLALASQWAPSLRLGCSCHPIQIRGPGLLAQSAAALAQTAPGRFVLGVGASSPTVVENWNATAWEKPYSRMRDGLRFLRAALAGERVDESYETFSVRRFQLTVPLDPPPPIFAAALRPKMLSLAGREADGVLLNWITPDDVPRVLETVNVAGRDVESVIRVIVLPNDDLDAARAVARQAVTGTLTVPTYRAHQEWLGRGDLLAPMWNAWEARDRKAAIDAVPDAFLDEMIVMGPVDRCRERIERFYEAGIDTVILEIGLPAADVLPIAQALAPR